MATPLTPQDVADCVNALAIDKPTFTAFLKGATLLAQRNQIQAQIEAANAGANEAQVAAQAAITGLRAQLQAVDAEYRTLVGG